MVPVSHKQVVACHRASTINDGIVPLENDLLNVSASLVITDSNWWVWLPRNVGANLS